MLYYSLISSISIVYAWYSLISSIGIVYAYYSLYTSAYLSLGANAYYSLCSIAYNSLGANAYYTIPIVGLYGTISIQGLIDQY